MILTIKPQHKARVLILIAFAIIGLLPTTGPAKPNSPVKTLLLREPWDQRTSSLTKTVTFQQDASGGTDATGISKIRLSYFTSANCSGTGQGTDTGSIPSPSYTTPDGTPFPISVGVPFGLVATSTWNVAVNKLLIAAADMPTIQSVAITFKSTNSNTPQANFSGRSVACVPVTCTAGPSGQCTSLSSTQIFTLKTTAAVGDAAEGGVIGCQNTGASFNLFDIIVTIADQSAAQGWGGDGTTTSATSTTDGATNTATIVATLGTGSAYAARTCSELSGPAGFTSGWFLPSGSVTNSQLNCLYNNRDAIATGSTAAGGNGFNTGGQPYWSSTESSAGDAWREGFGDGSIGTSNKNSPFRVRCSRAF